MKKIIFLSLIIAVSVFSACDDLIEPEVGRPGARPEQEVVTIYDNLGSMVNAIYTYLPNGFFQVGDAMLACASDEAEFTSESAPVQNFNTGSWNAMTNPDNAWRTNYQGVYAANLYLAKSGQVNLDYLLLDPSKYTELAQALEYMARWEYEARFLRAFYYFELIKRYGGVAIIEEPLSIDDDWKAVPRSSLNDCVQYIVNECDSAASHLPANYGTGETDSLGVAIQGSEFGRATKGAAMALKSRVLLYAASDLFNSPDAWAGGYEHPEYISMDNSKTREERWQEAAQAAFDVMQLNEYVLHVSTVGDFSSLFRTANSPEIIFTRRSASSNQFENVNFPIGFDGSSGVTPLANLADVFEVKAGTRANPFSWDTPAHAADPFYNRDPRFVMSILKNGDTGAGFSLMRPANPTVETWEGADASVGNGLDSKRVSGASKTGYYLHKYANTALNLRQGQSSVHTWILFRYAEIVLNYAEAVNEAYGPTTAFPGASETPNLALSTIRKRANMPEYRTNATQFKTKETMREGIRKERQREMAFEDQRLWDVRRWMIAPETLGVPARGINITKNSDETYTYAPFVLENRYWDNKMYFYPIPDKELKIMGWAQNPLW